MAAGQRSDAVKLFMRHVGMPALLIAILRLLPLWSKVTAVAGSLPYDAAIMGDGSVPGPAAASVRVPSLVFGGDKSPEGLRNAVHAAADAIPGAQRLMLKGQTHNVSAKALAPVLREFFAA